MERRARARRLRGGRAGAGGGAGRRTGSTRARSDHDRAHAHRRSRPASWRCCPIFAPRMPALRAATIEALQALPDSGLALHGVAARRQRYRRAHPGHRIGAQHAGGGRHPPAVRAAGARAASQCLRGGDRRAGGGGHAGRPSRPCGLRRTIFRNTVPAVRRLGRHRPDFRRRKASIGMARSEAPEARAVHITQEDVRRLCEFLYRRTGMSFADNKRYYIDRRLAERIAATQSASFQSYFAMLRSDADHEIEHLVNAFTVNETYFNREEHQLRCMTSNLLNDVIRGKRPEESAPHLVGSLFDRRRALFDCDLADGKLEPGRQLQYRDRRVRHRHTRARGRGEPASMAIALSCGFPGSVIGRYFQPIAGDRHQIDPGLRNSIQFTSANLIDTQDMARVSGLRHHLLPQRADLFRRCIAPDRGRKPL